MAHHKQYNFMYYNYKLYIRNISKSRDFLYSSRYHMMKNKNKNIIIIISSSSCSSSSSSSSRSESITNDMTKLNNMMTKIIILR